MRALNGWLERQTSWNWCSNRARSLIVVLLAGMCTEVVVVSSAAAQEKTDLSTTALAQTPKDAAMFATSINMGKAWQDFAKGPFVARLRGVRYVQTLERELAEQWSIPDGPLGQVRSTLQNPNVKNILDLLSDMGSHECFFYADDDLCDSIEALVQFQTDMLAVVQENPAALGDFFSKLDRADVDRIRIPTLVFGFRLTNDENARLQLDALEGIIRLAGGQIEPLKPALKKLSRADLNDGQTLTMTFDTSLIPVDAVPEENRAVVERVVEMLEGRSVSLSMGVKSKILMIAISEQLNVIDEFGQSPEKLLDHEAMAVLKQADLNELRGVSFASRRWRESQWNANFGHYFRNLSAQLSGAIGLASEIPDAQQWKEDIARDAQQLDERIGDLAPGFGDMLAWNRATSSGAEGWAYDWSKNAMLDNGAPIGVLTHAGANSLMLFGFKQKNVEAVSDLFDYLMDKAPGHIERFINAAEQDEDDRKLAIDVFEESWPLLEDAVEIFREKIMPSLNSNETLFSFAANWTTQELGPSLPPAAEPLPLPELAVACKLNDRDLFMKGCEDLYEVFDEAVELVRELNPEGVPADYRIPRPRETSVGSATSYYYEELSQAISLAGFQPQLMVADDVIVIGFSDRQVRDMVVAQPFKTRPAWMKDSTPVASVVYFDAGGMFAAVRPWVKYGLMMTGVPLDEPFPTPPSPFTIPSGNDLLQIWDCFTAAGKSAGTMQVDENGPSIARWVWVSQ